jgi:hypothetical protein
MFELATHAAPVSVIVWALCALFMVLSAIGSLIMYRREREH